MSTTDKNYLAAIQANIAVHSVMANDYNTIEPHFRPESIQRVIEHIEKLKAENNFEKVLDLGCGTGFMINILKPFAKEIKGVDVTQAMMDKVDTSGPAKIELVNSDTGSVELKEGYYELATAYTFLDHLYDMRPTFENCFKSLKRGGIFYADLSPNASFWDQIKDLDKTRTYDPIIEREIKAVMAKDEEIESQFGVKKEVFAQAEFQKHVEGGLREEKVRKQLEEVGFTNIEFIYHWYIGQAQLVNDTSLAEDVRFSHAKTMHEYLLKSMPLSKHLFKYIGFIARK